jgi:proteasome lid subunit RPN8/RPN11
MAVKSRIATETLAAIMAEATVAHPLEVCGLLLGHDELVTAHMPAANVAADPLSRFEIDPAVLLGAHRGQRVGGPSILGCYHSHPHGPPSPSVRDAADAEPNGWLWLIVARGEVRLWRVMSDGAVHGRFDPVPFACVEGPASPQVERS